MAIGVKLDGFTITNTFSLRSVAFASLDRVEGNRGRFICFCMSAW